MFKKILLVTLLASAISCSGGVMPPPAPPPVPSNEPAPPPESKVRVLSGEGWALTISKEYTIKKVAIPNILVLAFHQTDKRLVFLVRAESTGTLDDHVTKSTTAFADKGMTLGAQTKGELNGTPFVQVVASKGLITINHWLLVNGGFNYTLSCGGMTEQAVAHATACAEIAATLTLK